MFGVITSFMPFYWGFVFTWWITGTMAIACYTAAFVWTMEICAGELLLLIRLCYDDIFSLSRKMEDLSWYEHELFVASLPTCHSWSSLDFQGLACSPSG